MKYQFTINTTALDLWQLSLYGTYGSILGMTNVVFTAAMILLSVRFFADAHIVLKCLLIITICIFPVIQPILVYLQARKQVKNLPGEVQLGFDDYGIHIFIGNQKEDIHWSSVRGINRKPTLLVIFSSAQHGYVLNNKVLGEQKEEFYNYICSRMNEEK